MTTLAAATAAVLAVSTQVTPMLTIRDSDPTKVYVGVTDKNFIKVKGSEVEGVDLLVNLDRRSCKMRVVLDCEENVK